MSNFLFQWIDQKEARFIHIGTRCSHSERIKKYGHEKDVVDTSNLFPITHCCHDRLGTVISDATPTTALAIDPRAEQHRCSKTWTTTTTAATFSELSKLLLQLLHSTSVPTTKSKGTVLVLVVVVGYVDR